ncbi:hypothetical protein PENSPDRAFT_238220, partial [Peniophora sp. CONT]
MLLTPYLNPTSSSPQVPTLMDNPQTAQVPQHGGTFLKPEDKFWNLFITDAEKRDKMRLERWKGDADGILIFTGLFAATVATFVVSTIPDLSPDTGEQTVVLLSQVIELLANQSGKDNITLSVPPDLAFEPSTSSIWVNSLWLTSLFLALFCALAATLVQQWARIYSQGTQCRGSPSARGPIYAGLAKGMERFHLEHAIAAIILILHISVIIFCIGLLVSLFSVHHIVASVLSFSMAVGTLIYVLISTAPLVEPWGPIRTPLSPVIKLIMFSML